MLSMCDDIHTLLRRLHLHVPCRSEAEDAQVANEPGGSDWQGQQSVVRLLEWRAADVNWLRCRRFRRPQLFRYLVASREHRAVLRRSFFPVPFEPIADSAELAGLKVEAEQFGPQQLFLPTCDIDLWPSAGFFEF